MKEERPVVSQEFEQLYAQIDKKCSELAYSILDHVKHNEERLLKKVLIRLDKCIEEVKNIN
jgi:hypothetical protein